MALTTRKPNAFNNPSKSTRQQIPPFLSKLYHMVNDSNTDFLIRWSDAGDSFYVYDHERFAKEVLPHWFKHGNFGSFVRQLNNYGFHKVPHLQQGVLKSGGDTEVSHFENQNFQRGQSDLLCLIQRKKQNPSEAPEEAGDVKEHEASSSAQANCVESDSTHTFHHTKGTVLDINGIVNGIQAIKRHQQTISTELKDLHQSNQGLWQEAFAARERHKKHHDTITRILKFLAGIFGQAGGGTTHAQGVPNEASDNPPNSTVVVHRRPNRLMIENGKDFEGKASEVLNGLHLNVNADDFMEPLDFEGGKANDGDRFATIETPAEPPSPALSGTRPEAGQPPSDASPQTFGSKSASSTSQATHPTTTASPSPPSNHNRLPSPDLSQVLIPDFSFPTTDVNSSILTPNVQSDQMLQNSFTSIFNSPAHLQRVLAALQSQMPASIPPDPGLEQTHVARESVPPTSPLNLRRAADSQLSGSTFSLLSAAANMGALSLPSGDDMTAFSTVAQNTSQLQKSYKDATDVEADVNTLQGHIDSLIESLGLDPNTTAALRGEQPQQHAVEEIVSSSTTATNLSPPPSQLSDVNPDFDFEAFLSQDFDSGSGLSGLGPASAAFDATMQQNGAERLGAFLDEVRSVSNESDMTAGSPPGGGSLQTNEKEPVAKGSKKRKSDVAELVDELHAETKTQRKGYDI